MEYQINYYTLIGDKPNNLIVDWVDQDNPQVLLEIGSWSRVLLVRWGEQFENIIEKLNLQMLSNNM